VLNVMLTHLDEWIRERRSIAEEYRAGLREVVRVPEEAPGCVHTFQTFVILAERRNALLEHLKRRGIDAKVHYPMAIHAQPAARALGHRRGDFPVAEWLAEHVVSLPLYSEMTAQQRAAVVDGVVSFYRGGTPA
jgi:dTDP-4-amino-4,6-dideoxygalactose transaminase